MTLVRLPPGHITADRSATWPALAISPVPALAILTSHACAAESAGPGSHCSVPCSGLPDRSSQSAKAAISGPGLRRDRGKTRGDVKSTPEDGRAAASARRRKGWQSRTFSVTIQRPPRLAQERSSWSDSPRSSGSSATAMTSWPCSRRVLAMTGANLVQQQRHRRSRRFGGGTCVPAHVSRRCSACQATSAADEAASAASISASISAGCAA